MLLLRRGRVPVLRRGREAVVRGDFELAGRFAADLATEGGAAALADDFARNELDFFALLRLAVERFAADRLAVEAFRARVVFADDGLVEPSSKFHLPDMTRCAASATASAMRAPSLVALATILLAACVAVSAASRPASRMARRALGLALIAAAAAASPAASISLLIAALAILSTVSFREAEPEERLRSDLAMTSSPSISGKRHFRPSNGSNSKRPCTNAPIHGSQRACPQRRYVKGHRCT